MSMDTRTQLHAIVDDFNDDELFAAEMYLKGILLRRGQPQRSELDTAELRKRSDEFRMVAEQHWKEAGLKAKASGGIISGFGGGGGFGLDFQGRPTGKMSYEYSYGNESCVEMLRFIAGQEIDIAERFLLTDDGKSLLYEQTAKSGGRAETCTHYFPFNAQR
jgi:hypothetical protein